MKLRNAILMALSLYGLTVFVACSDKGSEAPPLLGEIACPAGSNYSANGNCYDQYGRIVGGVGINPGFLNVDAGYLADNVRYNNLTITDFGAYKDFLKNANSICDRAHLNYGDASCDSWLNSYFLVGLQSFGSQANAMRLVFYTEFNPGYGSNWDYSAELPSLGELFAGMFGFPVYSGVGNPRAGFEVQGVASVINASKGFEVRGYGPEDTTSNRSLIQLIVSNGKILDTHLKFKLMFRGVQMAQGTFGRCTNSNCQ
jgi:hypothetical protein